MESHGSPWRNRKRKPLFDLTNTAPSLSSSSSSSYSNAASLLKPNPNPKPKPQSSDPTSLQLSNPDETSARSNSGFHSAGLDYNGIQVFATPSTWSRETFLHSVDNVAQHDKVEHYMVCTRQTAEEGRCKEKKAGSNCKEKEAGSKCKEKEAGSKCKEKEAGRRCKEKAVPSTMVSCPPVARSRSIRGKLVMDKDKADHPKAFSVPYQEAKKKKRYTRPEAISKPTLPQDFVEKQKAYFAEIDAFELPEEVVSGSELE